MSGPGNCRTILITGASRGIGKAIALKYAENAPYLYLLGRDRISLEKVAKDCRAAGGSATSVVVDIRDAENLKSCLLDLDSRRPIDLLIANAGVTSGLPNDMGTEPWDDLQAVARTNFHGTLNTVAPLLENMIARNHGQIAIMGSLAATNGLPFCPSYSAAKAGIETYGRALRTSLKRHNVRINVISPGYVDTDMSRRLSGPKPYMITPERAAEIIHKGLDANKARIVFPSRLGWLTALSAHLPERALSYCHRYFAFTVMPKDL